MPREFDTLPSISDASCEILWQTENRLGEGAFWDYRNQRLLWLDILAGMLYVQQNQSYASFPLPVAPSAIWKVEGDRVYLATSDGIGELGLRGGAYRTLVEVEANRPDTRSNDGGSAPDGSFWFGTMLRDPVSKGGALYRVAPDLTVQTLDAPVGIPNTFLFPAGGRYVLIGDSFDRRIFRYEWRDGKAEKTGVWMEKAPESVGVPDGSALIDNMAVVNAEWDGGRLVTYTMDGKEYDSLELPVSRPTSCALGDGEDRVLYVTTARQGLTEEQLKREPLAGAVFAVHLNPPDGSEQ